MSRQSHPSWFNYTNNIWWSIQVMKVLIIQSFRPPTSSKLKFTVHFFQSKLLYKIPRTSFVIILQHESKHSGNFLVPMMMMMMIKTTTTTTTTGGNVFNSKPFCVLPTPFSRDRHIWLKATVYSSLVWERESPCDQNQALQNMGHTLSVMYSWDQKQWLSCMLGVEMVFTYNTQGTQWRRHECNRVIRPIDSCQVLTLLIEITHRIFVSGEGERENGDSDERKSISTRTPQHYSTVSPNTNNEKSYSLITL
jgi:hypothetical protein